MQRVEPVRQGAYYAAKQEDLKSSLQWERKDHEDLCAMLSQSKSNRKSNLRKLEEKKSTKKKINSKELAPVTRSKFGLTIYNYKYLFENGHPLPELRFKCHFRHFTGIS